MSWAALAGIWLAIQSMRQERGPADVNLVSRRLLRAGKGESLNVKGAYLEVWADMLGPLGVSVAAVVIRFTGWVWVDTAVAVGIGLWVLPRTWLLLKESLNTLLRRAARQRGHRGRQRVDTTGSAPRSSRLAATGAAEHTLRLLASALLAAALFWLAFVL